MRVVCCMIYMYDMLYACMFYVVILLKADYQPQPLHCKASKYVFVCVFTNFLYGVYSSQFAHGSLRATVCKSYVLVSLWLMLLVR